MKLSARPKHLLSGLLVGTVTFFNAAPNAFAVGSSATENASFSAISISQANAVTAQGSEPAAISYNPAGIADLKGIQAQGNMGLIHVFTHAKQPNGSTLQSDSNLSIVPTGYVTINPGKSLNDRLVLGIGSDSPFGLTNKYDSNNPAVKYTGSKNFIKMFTLKPTLAYKFTDWLSVAAGAMNYRIFDMGAHQEYPLIPAVGGNVNNPGHLKVNMSGSSWGWHMGMKVTPTPKHQFGFYFRSPVKVHVRGRLRVTNVNHALTANGGFETGVYSNVDLPMNMTWGYAFKPTPKTTLETDFGYTRWSTYNRLRINATDRINAIDDAILRGIGDGTGNDADYDDTFSIHLGGNHKVTDKLTLMAGTLFYTAAVPKGHFSPAVPDSNRIAFSLGLSYQLSKMLAIDLAYYNMIGLRRSVNNDLSEDLGGGTPGGSVDGRYTSVYQVGLISFRFMWDEVFGKSTIQEKAAPEPAQKLIVSPTKK